VLGATLNLKEAIRKITVLTKNNADTIGIVSFAVQQYMVDKYVYCQNTKSLELQGYFSPLESVIYPMDTIIMPVILPVMPVERQMKGDG